MGDPRLEMLRNMVEEDAVVMNAEHVHIVHPSLCPSPLSAEASLWRKAAVRPMIEATRVLIEHDVRMWTKVLYQPEGPGETGGVLLLASDGENRVKAALEATLGRMTFWQASVFDRGASSVRRGEPQIDAELTTREKAARTRAISRCLESAIDALVKRARFIELHAAKNGAAGFVRAQEKKLREAVELRHVAVLLSDVRLRKLVRDDLRLSELLISGPTAWHYLAKPRVIPAASVTPTIPWSDRRSRRACDDFHEGEC